ncbi:NUDIX domain-containing protein [Hyphomicrobium sulfonivorans]|uniref:NUDIX domain-containing protein n=1 Tax=Hyphomicrobium sulfonivorans TaxID=121290 RepID=UPI001571380D|nr:NUDIX hydrolase [Hyphomicrobium sulfonivorans]MBI1648450.1 NUDIX hydrolase [Hyphomicrobium sulfonivorans]NSL71012.1 DNA mismatch repair protein MutT [Hyphomicrobium sulfonivorans]
MAFPATPALTTDCVVFDDQRRVLLIQRANEPFRGGYALPGGFVDIGERVDDACRRELHEETGLEIPVDQLRLVGVYSDPKRDPRGHTCSVAYLTQTRNTPVKGGDDAASAEWVANWRELQLAFDHAQIISDAERLLLQGPSTNSEPER